MFARYQLFRFWPVTSLAAWQANVSFEGNCGSDRRSLETSKMPLAVILLPSHAEIFSRAASFGAACSQRQSKFPRRFNVCCPRARSDSRIYFHQPPTPRGAVKVWRARSRTGGQAHEFFREIGENFFSAPDALGKMSRNSG